MLSTILLAGILVCICCQDSWGDSILCYYCAIHIGHGIPIASLPSCPDCPGVSHTTPLL